MRPSTAGSWRKLTTRMPTVSTKEHTALMGTITSRLFTVAFLRSTMRAASAVSTSVVVSGGMWNAFWNAELTELEIT